MSQDFVEHIFEPFERESTVTQSGIQGTGLGMAITKNIVEMMNGTISVESKIGKGSTFTVEFGLKLQDMEKTTKQIGLRSEWTTSGREAVYRAKTAYEEGDSYHTFIIDWQMPGLSGVDTTRKIREAVGDEAPIIILTAYDWMDIEDEAKAAGFIVDMAPDGTDAVAMMEKAEENYYDAILMDVQMPIMNGYEECPYCQTY